jgi:hypothetical protein
MKRRYLINMLLGALAGLFALVTVAVFPDLLNHPWKIPHQWGLPSKREAELIQAAVLLRLAKMFIDHGLLYAGIPALFALGLCKLEEKPREFLWIVLKSLQVTVWFTVYLSIFFGAAVCLSTYNETFDSFVMRTWGGSFAIFAFICVSGIACGIWGLWALAFAFQLYAKREAAQAADTAGGAENAADEN